MLGQKNVRPKNVRIKKKIENIKKISKTWKNGVDTVNSIILSFMKLKIFMKNLLFTVSTPKMAKNLKNDPVYSMYLAKVKVKKQNSKKAKKNFLQVFNCPKFSSLKIEKN